MIETLYQIDFIDAAGSATRLLSAGDLCAEALDFPVQQQTEGYGSLGMEWGGGSALGGARRPLSWTRLQEHASHAVAAGYSIRHPATMPLARTGKLRITITGGEVWDLAEAVLISAATRLSPADGAFATLTTYQCAAGASSPVSGLAHYAGIPTAWILETHTSIGRTHAAS